MGKFEWLESLFLFLFLFKNVHLCYLLPYIGLVGVIPASPIKAHVYGLVAKIKRDIG
jgi:hypothetical protein